MVSVAIKLRVLTTIIDYHDGTASLDLALGVASDFELTLDEAQKIAAQVAKAVSGWRVVAGKLGTASKEIERMASAFEHEDLKSSLKLGTRRKVARKL